MKLKLTDKIKKFFGQQQHVRPNGAGDDYSGLVDLARLEAVRPPVLRSDGTPASFIYELPPSAAGSSNAVQHGIGSGSAPGDPHGKAHMPSTLSQKADLSSNPRTTGQDESYSLQNEVYFPQLILTLQTGSPEQKAVAAEALFNYTAESDSARQRATQAGVVVHLIDLLQHGTDHGKMYAAYTLSSLTSIEEALNQMCTLGAIPALIYILSNCPLLVCKKGAMRALGRLARNDQAAVDIVAAGGLTPIIGLLSRPDSSLVRRCLIALYFIGADKDALQQAIGAAGALPHLLALARSESPDVQAEAADVLKVLCRNSACGRSLADMGGIEVLAALVHGGLTSRTKASAARALQRLNDIPDVKEQLASSSARDIVADGSNSLLNTSTAAVAAAAAVATFAASASLTSAFASAAIPAGTDATAVTAPGAAGLDPRSCTVQAAGANAADGAGIEVDDMKQLAEVLATSTNRWLREKAAAAVEQLAVDDLQSCRELAELGCLGSLLDMVSSTNSSVTRRAGARALGRMGDDPTLLRHMAEPGFVLRLLQAAPELAGSAQRSVIKLLHALAHDDSTVTAFPKQQTAAYLMQLVEGNPLRCAQSAAGAEVAAAQLNNGNLGRNNSMGGLETSNGDDAAGDVSAAIRAIEVLVAVSSADPQLLLGVKEYPGSFRLLVNKLQHGSRLLTSPILRLLACLAKSCEHQEDLLKGGVVPVLLGLYRSDDANVAMQAAKVMELLSEPAAQILERSLSKGDILVEQPQTFAAAPGATPAMSPDRLEALRALSPTRGSRAASAAASISAAAPAADSALLGCTRDRSKVINDMSSSDGCGSTAAVVAVTAGNSSSCESSGNPHHAVQGCSLDGTSKAAPGNSYADLLDRQFAGRSASPSRGAPAAADIVPPTAAGSLPLKAVRASSLGLGGSPIFKAGPSRKGVSFTAKRSPPAVQAASPADVPGADAAACSSPAGRGQQQQDSPVQPQQQSSSLAKPLPKRTRTPDSMGSSSSRPTAVSKQQQLPNGGAAAVAVEAAQQAPVATAGARSSSAMKDRPSAVGVEQSMRPGSSSNSKKPASATPRGSSATGIANAAAAARQRLIAGRKPSYAVVNALQNEQQQQQATQDAAPVPLVDPALAGRPPVLQMAAAIAAATGATVTSPKHTRARCSPPPLQQQQQAQQPQQQAPQQAKQQHLEQPSQESAAKAPGQPMPAVEPAAPPALGFGIVDAAAPFVAAVAAASAGSSPEQKQEASNAAAAPSPDKQAGSSAAGGSGAADADDLLSSTYDNLHGLLMKKSDIEICRTAEGRKCRLGEGGFGVVYKAVMNGVDEVAVKLVKADSPSRKELELFLKEVQTLAKLHHRNIVQFYGACLETGSMFFVTELMKGGDLYTALRHHSETMRWERLGRKVALDVALGLNYLHAQRPPMMHRDLKSPNVLLSEEGVAKIADVGMVRSQVKDLVTAQPVMTPLWAAPEVVRHERASIKADIWSYGILIWELISGEDITEYQPLSISRQVGPSPNAKAMTLPAKCPAVARKLFTACTQMDPERRPVAQTLVEWLRSDMQQNRF